MALTLLLALAPQDPALAEAIRLLGEEAVEVREAAMTKLKGRSRAIVPQLRRALEGTSDPEVRARIARVIQHLTRVRWHTDLASAMRTAAAEKKLLLAFSTAGPLDGYV